MVRLFCLPLFMYLIKVHIASHWKGTHHSRAFALTKQFIGLEDFWPLSFNKPFQILPYLQRFLYLSEKKKNYSSENLSHKHDYLQKFRKMSDNLHGGVCGSCAIFFPNISFLNPSSHLSLNTFLSYGVAATIAKKSIKTLQIILYKIHMNVRFCRAIISPHMDGILENTP